MFAVLLTSNILANPVLGNIAHGNVSIQQTPNSTVINQSSQKAIINWQSFNIGNSESTHFQQPNGGVALNRISPTQGVSQIFGVLSATGQIILVNPAGIYFGPSAFVNVGGLIATTANITDEHFLNNVYQFDKVPGYSGAIVNQGKLIAADHGLIALVGNGVENDGTIQANLGHIVLASGDAYTMNFSGNDLINFTITTPTSHAGIDKDGNLLKNGVSNTGRLIADGGQILVTAQAAQGVLDNVIDMRGVAQARSVGQRNGEIIISGDTSGGEVYVNAKLNASGTKAGETGGNVAITGYNILLDSATAINVNGDAGGGNIFVGGSARGQGPLPNANATIMAPGASLSANALTNGNGGHIVLWSNYYTNANGTMSATGGALGGNGGLIETSSHDILDVSTLAVNTSAPHGSTGTWLLDPGNVTVSTSATSGGSFSGTNPATFTPSGATANVLNTDIQTNLATNNVEITTGTGGTTNTITVNAPITWSSSNFLLLNANATIGNAITINSPITATNGTLELQTGALASTITTGSSGTINVANFNLLQGTWNQVSATLPSFSVTNNFQINSGIMPNSNAAFIRATSGNGSSGSPFIITDVYGLQGIGSTSTTLADSWQLGGNISATGTSTWNSGVGFIPIGNATTGFTGSTFNGAGFTINGLTENNSSNNSGVGLFGNQSASGSLIENVGITNASITGGALTGILIGSQSAGTITNTYTTGSVSGNQNGLINYGLGGLAGALSGTLNTSYSGATVSTTGVEVSGGLVGSLEGTINNSYAYGSVTSTGPASGFSNSVGGLVGFMKNASAINTSYSSGAVSGGTNATAGGLLGILTTGSCVNCFWDTQSSGLSTSALGTGETTAAMQTLATFTPGVNNWSITSTPSTTATTPSATWFIFPGVTRPILLMEFSTTVTNPHQLQLIGSTLGANYTLANNIDLSSSFSNVADVWATNSGTSAGTGFAPIASGLNVYSGTLNGAGFTVSNLFIKNSTVGSVGFISSNSGIIENLNLSNISISGATTDIGGIAAFNSNTGSMTGDTVTGTITGSTAGNVPLGGLVGHNNGSVSNSYSGVNVTAVSGTENVGGLVGNNDGSIFGSYANGTVTAPNGQFVGGLAGGSAGSISNSYSLGAVSATGASATGVGGLAGLNTAGSVTNSYSLSPVTVTNGTNVGGLVGLNSSTISTSYATGFISSSGATNVGGLVGSDNGGAGTTTNSFWDTQATGQSGSAGGTGKTTSAMMTQSTFTGFNFTSPWAIIAGQSYPFLSAFFSGTPRAIFLTSSASGGATGKLAVNGSVFDSIEAGANGSFYYFEGNNVISGINHSIADGGDVLAYIDSGPTHSNAVAVAPTGGGSLSPLSLTTNALTVGSTASTSISNTDLATAAGSISDTDILYSVSGNNLTLGNASNTAINFSTTGTTTYTANGTIAPTSGGSGSFTFNGPTTINASSITSNGTQTYNGAVTLSTTATLNTGAGSNNITFANGVSGAGQTLSLESSTTANTGLMTFDGTTNLGALNTFGGSANYAVSLLGSGTITNALTFNNTGGVTISGGGTYNFTNGLTSNVTSTSLGATINTTNSPVVLGAVSLLSNSSISTGSGTVSIGAVSGSNNLSLSSGGATLGGTINIAALSLSGGGTDTINTTSITTSGNQTFGDKVNLSASLALTGSAVNLNNGVSGNQNLTLNGTTLGISGTLGLNNLAVNGTGASNTFTLATSDAQNWNITGTNGGNITNLSGVSGTANFTTIQNLTGGSGSNTFTVNGGTLSGTINGGSSSNNTLVAGNTVDNWNVTGANSGNVTGVNAFNNIQNLTGGNSGNTFVFANNASVSGNINGGSLSNTNTINYSAYTSPVSVTLSGIFQGTTTANSSSIGSFSNINALITNSAISTNTLNVPNKFNALVISNAQQGQLNDPLTLSGFTVFNAIGSNNNTVNFTVPFTRVGSNQAIVGGVTMTFNGFLFPGQTAGGNSSSSSSSSAASVTTATSQSNLPDVSNILQQPQTNAYNNAIQSTNTWGNTNGAVTQNVDELINATIQTYDTYLSQIKINPYCYQAGQ